MVMGITPNNEMFIFELSFYYIEVVDNVILFILLITLLYKDMQFFIFNYGRIVSSASDSLLAEIIIETSQTTRKSTHKGS
jgi:hypothetical protein